MRRVAIVLPATVAILVIALGTSRRAADTLVLSRFSDYLESLRIQAGIPGLAASLVGTTDTVWERGFGYQDAERNIATRTDTPFAADGLMQTIVATLALRCEEGRWLAVAAPAAQSRPPSGSP